MDSITHAPADTSAVQGGVRWLLRAEGLALMMLAAWAYAQWGQWGWAWFAALFLLPDLALLAYAAGPRAGARCYNATHSTLGACALLLYGSIGGQAVCQSLAMIWLTHIGFDRALGYGLKYPQGFALTHLGRIGKHAPRSTRHDPRQPGR